MSAEETKSPQSNSGSHGVQLGIGTLFIIAIIVSMCSGRSEMQKIQKDTADIKTQLQVIDKKLDAMVENGGAITFRNVEVPAAPVNEEPAAPRAP